MTTKEFGEKQRLRDDIAEAFDFVRFLVKNPGTLRKIKNGAEIRIVPAACSKLPAAHRPAVRVQSFAAQTVFRSLP